MSNAPSQAGKPKMDSLQSGTGAMQAAGIVWSLWAAATTIPWLLPTHSAPWTTFYQELAMAAAMILAGGLALLSYGRWRFDVLSTCFLVAALIPVLQAAFGMFALPAEAPLVSLYLVGFAATMLVARHAEDAWPGRLIEALFAGLLAAALFSTGIALYQWLGGDALGLLVAPMPFRDRPVANVGQPNNLATLLAWGLTATWWAHSRRKIGAIGAVLAAAFLLVGVTLTQSRAGAIQVGLLGAVAFALRRKLGTSAQAKAFAGLAVWWLACVYALEPLTELWTAQTTRSMLDLDSSRERTQLLKTVLTAIAEHPWIGYGWYQNVAAHVAVASRTAMHGLVANSHNIVLDLVIWNGLPLGLMIALGLCFWFWRTSRRAATSEQVLILVALATFCVHANLELPHVFAYFLLPVAVMIGTLSASLPVGPVVISVRRSTFFLLLLAFSALWYELFAEYRRIETNLTGTRMRVARIARAPASSDPHAPVLKSLQTWMTTLQIEPDRGMSSGELGALRRIVTRYPTALALLRYAEASALNGHANDARWALDVLCSLRSTSECQAAASDWAALTADGRPELASVQVPVAPTRWPQ